MYENKNFNELFILYFKKLYVWNFNVVVVKYKFKKKICNISNLGYLVLFLFRNKKKFLKLMLKLNNFISLYSIYDFVYV